jgi:hypothetical protein
MKRTMLIAGGTTILIALLAGAAFVGAQMLGAPQDSGDDGPGVRVIELVADVGDGPVSLKIRIEPAAELPDRPAAAAGIFVRRQDNSIFVGTGAIELDVEVDGATGEEKVNLSHSGPEVEVVVSRDTIVYRDETEMPTTNPETMKSGEKTIQQVIRPVDSSADIRKNTELQVWGEKRGDRIVAQVIVYRILEGF